MMNGLMHVLCNFNNISLNWFIMLADGTIKGTVILAIIILLVKLRSRFRPQTIHLILFLTVISFLAIPLLTQGIAFLNDNHPGVNEGTDLSLDANQPANQKPEPVIRINPQILNGNHPGVNEGTALSLDANQPANQKPEPVIRINPQIPIRTALANQLPHWSVWLFAIWSIGVMIMLGKLLMENIRIYHLKRNAIRIADNKWLLILDGLKAQVGLDSPVIMKFANTVPVSVVLGCFKPVIIIPESADNWSDERRRIILLHELSHIKRYDNLRQSIVYLVAIIYWFNPLIWIAVRLLKTSRELACDDQVLETGVLPSTYAAHLLAIIHTLRGVQPEFKTVVAMSTTNMEQRMVHILETKRNHNRLLTKRTFLGILLIAIVTVALCSITSVIGTTRTDSGQTTATDEYWPGAEWRTSTPEEQGMDSSYIRSMIEFIQEQQKEIHSLLIIRNGYLVTEAYFYPYQKGIKQNLDSCTKSITSALVGIAINEGYIKSINDKAVSFFPDVKIANLDKRKKALTLEHLLKMAAGFDWLEEADNSLETYSTTQMMNSKDPVQFILDRKMIQEPGKSFYYCTGASHLLSAILQRATGKSALEYGKEKLFDPMGMNDIHWFSDPKGVAQGGGGLYLTPADMAKFGYLFLQKGKWGGQQIVPEKWVQVSTQKQIKAPWFAYPNYNTGEGDYGYQWWKDVSTTSRPRTTDFEGYSARGFGGQYIFVIPESNLVVVFTGGNLGMDYPLPFAFTTNYILASIKSDKPLAKNPASEAALNKIITEVGQTPKAKPVSQLPELCNIISGKQYRMDDSISLSFQFGNNPNECIYQEWVYGTKKNEIHIGLDDVYRINQSNQSPPAYPFPGTNQLAAKGCWVNNTTFEINFQNLFEWDGIKATFIFKNDTVSFELVSKMLGYTILKDKGILQQ